MDRSSTPRVLVDWTLVLTLVTAALTGWAGAAHRPVPPEMVGTWQGGTHSNGRWYVDIAADGSYRAWPAGSPATVNTGTVSVDGRTVTFSNGGAPVADSWSVSDDRLVLDGESYRRS